MEKLFFENHSVLYSENMAGHTEPVNIAEIVNALEEGKNKTPKIALILGSRAGALFRSEYLYEELQFYSTRTFTDMKLWERFSECYKVLQNDEVMSKSERVNILKNALGHITFSKADISLAELIKQNAFKIVISANIDDLLYSALVNSDMKEGRDFIDFSLTSHLVQDELVDEVLHSNKPDACKIIHISDEAKKLVYNLNQPSVQEANGSFVKRLLERLRVKEVVLVGLDLEWDSALMSALPPKINTLWFVNEDERAMFRFLVDNHVGRCRYITGEDGSYEKFLIALYWGMNKDIPGHDSLHLEVLRQLRIVQSQLMEGHTNLHLEVLSQLRIMQSQLMEMKSIVERLEKEK